MKDSVECLFVLLGLLMLPILSIWNGWVLHLMWRWFIAEQFGVMPIGVVQAIGLSLVVGFLTHVHVENENDEWYSALLRGFVNPLVVLIFGWVVYQFI